MEIIPINFSYFDLVEVITTNNCKPTPHCKKHGAMNKMNTLEDDGGYWRCVAYVNRDNDTACRAGCCEKRNYG
jgi:hypothetical protein